MSENPHSTPPQVITSDTLLSEITRILDQVSKTAFNPTTQFDPSRTPTH